MMQEQHYDTDIDEWATDTILNMQEDLGYGLFTVKFDNSKKRGKGRTLQSCNAWGVLYPSGHVHLDTPELRVHSWLSLDQMRDYLEEFGKCEIEWVWGGIA